MIRLDILLFVLLVIALIASVAGFVLVLVAFVQKRPMKRALIVLGSSLAVLLLSFAGLGIYQAHEDQVAAEKARVARAERKKLDKEFHSTYHDMGVAAYTAAGSAEDLADKVQSTWGDAIFDDGGATVAGKQYTNFNDAIPALLVSESDTITKITDAEDEMDTALSQMKKYQTKNTKDDYAKSKELVREVKKLDSMATSPTGSYQDYGSNFNDQDTKVADLANNR
ncbi:hypothetical protein [Lacticaseibacillus hegangensis]|uniref:DUF308 domain-containing protein n=1 Tax=Lacticaseibacillus hegangensis TaxID=2486010 RepID=A0ABW4CUN6_9LACO|nr:hypothetical protein [Lacticaseibacillus hegangensis]